LLVDIEDDELPETQCENRRQMEKGNNSMDKSNGPERETHRDSVSPISVSCQMADETTESTREFVDTESNSSIIVQAAGNLIIFNKVGGFSRKCLKLFSFDDKFCMKMATLF
jgi:hypothetical protein